ncbi:MAG: metallophosphoesterase [candidate division WOR-3 bacterium]
MVKILHTSDIHLREYEDNSWKAFVHLIDLANKEKVKFFVISGDLFDEKVSFNKLYPELRPLLNNVEYDFIIIPGNHDEKVFNSDFFLGEKIKIIRKLNEPLEYENVRFFGYPFEKIGAEEIRNNLRKIKELATKDNKVNILLFHGELLNHSFSGSDFGEEETNYMGVWLSAFENINLKYVLAGHFHTNFQVYSLSPDGFFVYPGSPISITRKEIGKRSVNLFELGKPPKQHFINTFYYQKINLSINPEDKIKIKEEIEKILKEIPKEAKVLLTITGYIEEKEEEFQREIKEIEYRFENLEIENKTRGIKHLTEDDLFKIFVEKLEKFPTKRKREIKTLFIRSILESEK